MSCDRAAQVHAYHDRQLGPATCEAFELHLAQCAECAALLGELRAISRAIVAAPLPAVASNINERLYDAWYVAQQRGVLRMSSWLTGAAAAVLVGALLLTPKGNPSNDNPGVAVATNAQQQLQQATWEAVALMPPPERLSDRPDEYVELAQWIATDLSDNPGVR
jgi:anti-sigma factor RsiW